jgi:hypothetical protein
MQRRPFRRPFAFLAVILLLAGIASPAAAAPSRQGGHRSVRAGLAVADLVSFLRDVLGSPAFWRSLATGSGLSIDPNGGLKEGISVDPNGAPHTSPSPGASTVDEGGMIDHNG